MVRDHRRAGEIECKTSLPTANLYVVKIAPKLYIGKMNRSVAAKKDSADRSAYHHGDLRTALVRSGVEILEEQGLASLTLRETARRANVSHAAPYHHFADKEALLAAVAAEGFRMQHAAMAQAFREAGGQRDGLQAFGLVYGRFAQEHPALFRLMYTRERTPGMASEELSQAGSAVYQEMIRTLMNFVGLPQAQAETVALLLWTSVHGLAMLWLDGQLAWLGHKSIDPLSWIITEAIGPAIGPSAPPIDLPSAP